MSTARARLRRQPAALALLSTALPVEASVLEFGPLPEPDFVPLPWPPAPGWPDPPGGAAVLVTGAGARLVKPLVCSEMGSTTGALVVSALLDFEGDLEPLAEEEEEEPCLAPEEPEPEPELEPEEELPVVLQDSPSWTSVMLSHDPDRSLYWYAQAGSKFVISTLFTYIVNGAWLKSVWPPAQPTVPWLVLAPPAQLPSYGQVSVQVLSIAHPLAPTLRRIGVCG